MTATLYQTIMTRRSVREYDMTPLTEAELADIQQFVAATTPLPRQKATIELVSSQEVKDKHAPHYLLAYCETSNAAYANVGYVLEKADLYIQSLGLGSVWLGMAKPTDKKKNYCIMLAFGRTNVAPRTSSEEFKRQPIMDFSNEDNALAEAMRLAPSAMNLQPWYFQFAENAVTIHYVARGGALKRIFEKHSKVSVGIPVRHLVTALRAEGKEIVAITPNSEKNSFEIKVTYK